LLTKKDAEGAQRSPVALYAEPSEEAKDAEPPTTVLPTSFTQHFTGQARSFLSLPLHSLVL